MRRKHHAGVTLIELLVTLVVLAVLLGMALPSFQGSMRSNRVATATNEILASLALARTEAIKGLGPAGVCPSSDGVSCASNTDWSGGWLVWREHRAAGATVRTVVRYVQARHQMEVSGPADGIRFTTQGRSDSGAVQFGLSPEDAEGPARCIAVNASGQARTEKQACA
ncbi:MAG TPA: GspH/FimT family pseudopilin [Pseudoxanthomonas sp.]|nr:GspH/FimT family pseudopilin [Pseudoxanthomonas sp.]